jgi:hypothetical protein
MEIRDVRLHRDGDIAKVEGLDHVTLRHRPRSFNWGYRGTGPIRLAKAILDQAGRCVGEAYHQKFADDFIIRMPHEGGVVSSQDIEDWLVRNQIPKCRSFCEDCFSVERDLINCE